VATDHEHLEVPDRALVQFAEAADLLYLDGQYLQCEYDGDQAVGDSPAQRRNRWGHSWIEASLSTAIAAGATRIHLGHHDPHRSDSDLLKLEQFARQYVQDLNLPRSNTGTTSLGPEVMFAREGDTWSI
jgi:ribonuclease BN (tRNA processing enzyme)